MPQNASAATVAINPSRVSVPLNTDAAGNLLVSTGTTTHLDITTKTVIKTGPGRVAKVSFVTASTAAPGVYDAATTAAGVVAVALWVGPTETAVGTVVALDMPFANGLVVDPGTGGTVTVSFE